jgi:hypothetical protein
MVQSSQPNWKEDIWSVFLEELNMEVADGDCVELHVASILDLFPDDLKAEIGELKVLSVSTIRDTHEMFLGNSSFIYRVQKTQFVLTMG